MAAAIGLMVGSAIANAAAFIGGNAIYAFINKQDADEERIRHDTAIENLQKAQADWSEKRQAKLDYLNEQLQRELHADKVYSDINEAMHLYYEVTGGDETKLRNIPNEGDEPKLSEYYEASEAQKNYELIFLVAGVGATGWLAFRYL
jgi:proline dehydrogenase